VAASALTLSAIGSTFPPQFLGSLEHAHWFTSNKHTSFIFLIVFRVIGGIGVGITSVVAPIYISELTQPGKRGKFVSIYQLSITLGILFAFLVDWIILSHAGDTAGVISDRATSFWSWLFVHEIWRGMFGTELPIAVLFLNLLFFPRKVQDG
jgi:MFS family permease